MHSILQGINLQSMADLDKSLGAPTVPHLRYRCNKTEQKSLGVPLHYGHHCTNIKTSKSEWRSGALSQAFKNYLGCAIAILCIHGMAELVKILLDKTPYSKPVGYFIIFYSVQ